VLTKVKRTLIGRPMPSAQAIHERLSKRVGLAVFSSDAMSSSAYATDEILLALVVAGSIGLSKSIWVGLAIFAILVIVSTSYAQTIRAYPSGGGSYIVSRANLGVLPGLAAGAALLIDYVMTVAVSIAAGVAALAAAFPAVRGHETGVCVALIALVAVANLRGVRESGFIFSIPTYSFIFCAVALVLVGVIRLLTGTVSAYPSTVALPVMEPLTIFVILKAFASGCAALTGIEAISNGVPAFKPPESRNAVITLKWMAVILGSLFLGITFLALKLNVVRAPTDGTTTIALIGEKVFGRGAMFFIMQITTLAILTVAANTSFADFPRLSSIMAKDGYMPRQFRSVGDRLVFSNGVVALALVAALLVVIFKANVHKLIPLYAVGVFASFTLSQSGMVMHWRTEKGRRWRFKAIVNGVGAVTTGVAFVVIALEKFRHGAYIPLALIPLLILLFLSIHRHYSSVTTQLLEIDEDETEPIRHEVAVFVSGLHKGVIRALKYAKSVSPNHVRAVFVNTDDARTEEVRRGWIEHGFDVPLEIIDSPYRDVMGPLLRYVRDLDRRWSHDLVTVVIPEFVIRGVWGHFLHNQTALLLKGALLFQPNVAVVSLPIHLEKEPPKPPPPRMQRPVKYFRPPRHLRGQIERVETAGRFPPDQPTPP